MNKESIREVLKKSSNYSEKFSLKLADLFEKLIPDIEAHLKNINKTLPNFDIHDELHAESVLENMLVLSNYYKENTPYLTDIEYFLIYLSAYLHDSGMSLPEWQLNLFKATEGNDLFNLYEDIPLKVNNDGKKSFSFSEAKNFISENKKSIYVDFDTVKNYIFCESAEDKFIDNLAKKLIDYQNFRNRYAPDLENIREKQEYKKKSEDIRYEYIRSNHHIFSEKNCKLLVSKIESYFDKFTANKLCEDLSKIVVGHGIDFTKVRKYSLRSNYSSGNFANPFFITVLLRLGDIIHFSADRAPDSLLSSKLIHDPVSLIHWKVKQEDINFWLNTFDEKGNREISYSAYFTEPKLYYFFQDYMNWIDMEISNYNIFFNILEKDSNLSKYAHIYDMKLAEKVNRREVIHDEESFIPVENLKFVLNQNKILDLLMSVGLYKDKYLCLRELYQNAMDACKCAMAGGLIKNGIIEFGIETDNNGRYLYCLDNGMGMTKEIIENYFLNIGNSYYKSREFYELKAKWGKSTSNTSQFGVGILSCFMIGNEIEVVTKNLYAEKDDLISFKIDGPHENFYYKKGEDLDIERIGNNGTLIKIYLIDKEINNDYTEDFDLNLFFLERQRRRYFLDSTRSPLKSNIYDILFRFINVIPTGINISVKFSNGMLKPVFSNFEPLILTEISCEKLTDITKQNYNQEYIDNLLYIKEHWSDYESEVVEVNSENISLYSVIVFSNSENIESINRTSSYPLLERGKLVSIDGVIVDEYTKINNKFNKFFRRDINNKQPFIINFDGKTKPKLSVDRLSITEFPEELFEELKVLIEELKLEMYRKIKFFLEKHKNKEISVKK
ncbi:ATP-binding protein [Enterococcus thailandicus]|uniref:HD domain-containing protein n=1 Tax=Enterococcus thailandicus TaxID=417368 RepID=UPI0022EBDC4B|nr:ATP-binding protein [Enterococcus thailandicus]MDA3964905.1 ATP-binding protein [Enterococcus thailandicus]